MRKATTRITGALTSMPWAMTEDYLRLMLQIAHRDTLDIESVETQLGRKLDNTYNVQERNGVAIIPVIGPIFRYANLFSAISGGTSVQLLARDFAAALKNPDIKAILLQIDSPGGEVDGVSEFAEQVYVGRGIKPITAYVGGLGASAAYWIASAANEIVADKTAMLGSIGVVAAVPAGADDGAVEFVSSQSPRKHPDPQTADGAEDIQYTIDALAQVFVETVARNRAVTVDQVLDGFGGGSLFVGKHAVIAGMADRLGAFEGTLAELSGRGAEKQAAQMQQARTGAQHTVTVSSDRAPRQAIPVASFEGKEMFLPSASSAPSGGARSHTTTTVRKETTRMTDESLAPQLAPPPNLDDAPDTPALSADERAQLVASERQRYQAEIDRVRAEARLEVQREYQRQRRQDKIESYAQDATSPTLNRPYALPFEPKPFAAFLLKLDVASPDLCAEAQGYFDRILLAKLVDFSEVGSASGGEGYDVEAAWNAAVKARMDNGKLTRSAAIEAIKKEQPDLFREYNASGATITRKGGR